MKIRAAQAGIIFIILMVTGVIVTMISGYWATEGSKDPVKFEEGEFTGVSNPADIRGSYSFGDIEKAFDIPVDTLAAAFGFSGEDNPELIQVKSFEAVYGIINGKEIGTDSMRYFVALYKGLPFVVEEGTALPKPAASILRKEANLTEEQLVEISENSVTLETTHIEENSENDETELREIKGKTMFADLYDWGVSKEELEVILEIPVGVRGESIRDFCIANGIEFSTVKDRIQDLVDSK
ncbi:MAG: hypothetical protein PF518_02625 [Spirochaetaceae bacterium]|jgi:hypothetical protein|nr:hypothetical protein [Spirochaetaceae bacterium]